PRLMEHVAVLVHALAVAAHRPRQTFLPKRQHHLVNVAVGVLHDRVATRRLVARGDERVGRQRVVVGGRRFLLDEAAENSNLLWCQLHRRRSLRWLRCLRDTRSTDSPATSVATSRARSCARGHPKAGSPTERPASTGARSCAPRPTASTSSSSGTRASCCTSTSG